MTFEDLLSFSCRCDMFFVSKHSSNQCFLLTQQIRRASGTRSARGAHSQSQEDSHRQPHGHNVRGRTASHHSRRLAARAHYVLATLSCRLRASRYWPVGSGVGVSAVMLVRTASPSSRLLAWRAFQLPKSGQTCPKKGERSLCGLTNGRTDASNDRHGRGRRRRTRGDQAQTAGRSDAD